MRCFPTGKSDRAEAVTRQRRCGAPFRNAGSLAIRAAFLLLFGLSACAAPSIKPVESPPTRPHPDPGFALEQARKMIARSEYGRGREALSSLEGTQLERTQEAEVRYLSGLASYLEVCGLLDACGEAVPFRFMGVLRVEHRAMLSSACGDFLTASDLAPEAPFAAEAAYLAARTQDYGFLQNFTRAMELYRWCVIAYPGTPAAERSRVRYEVLKQRFESMEGTGHGTEGE